MSNNKFYILHFFLFSIFFCDVGTLYGFDVKVLLQKLNLQGCDQTLTLKSSEGFIISIDPVLALGQKYESQQLLISVKNGVFFINGKQSPEKMLFLYPALSQLQIMTLKSYVSCWLEQNVANLKLQASSCHVLFDDLVQSNDMLSQQRQYHLIDDYAFTVFELFFTDFLKSLDQEAVYGLENILNNGKDYLEHKVKNLFFTAVATHDLKKHERKNIEKKSAVRYEFFFDILQKMMHNLLQDFIVTLPRKLLCQILDQNVNCIEFQDQQYLGSFLLFQDKKQLLIINILDIDDYLLSVIKHEGWPGWPLEMNKVLAIICRTYLVWQVLQAKKINRPYHIENGIRHQTYKGHHQTALALKVAVDLTKDMFVSFDDKPALTMYDSCCGGIVPANIDDVEHKKISYLARHYPCTFCKDFKIFNWHVNFSEQEIIERLKNDFTKVSKIVDMTIQKKDRAGLVKKVLIHVGSRKISITEKKMKSLFPELKSYCFDIVKHSGKHFTISGRGYGHHKGLCQWGACKLVKDEHWTCQQVLQFYYPGTKLMKLTYQR